MIQRKLIDFKGDGVVIGRSHSKSHCQSHIHKDYDNFYTINRNPKLNPDFVFDLTMDLPLPFHKRFTLTVLENMDSQDYNNSPAFGKMDGLKGFKNALAMTAEEGFILIIGCPRDKDFRRSITYHKLFYLELDADVILIPVNQYLSIQEINNQIVCLDPGLKKTIEAVNKKDSLEFCLYWYDDLPCARMQFAEEVQKSRNKAFIQEYSSDKVLAAIDLYLKNRDQHLGFFSKYFDYARGLERAVCYKKLLLNSHSPYEFNLILTSLLANNEGKWLKKYVYRSLGFTDLTTARKTLNKSFSSFSSTELKTINQQIGSLVLATNLGKIEDLEPIPLPQQISSS